MEAEVFAIAAIPVLVFLSKKRKENASEYDTLFREKAGLFSLNMNLVKTIAKVESDWNPQAVGLAGELGMMQILPSTGAWLGYDVFQLMTPEGNIECGCKYLRWLMDQYGNRTEDAVSAYNQGQPDKDADGTYKNQSYVDKVMTLYNIYWLGSLGGLF
jgi:soluble lytic murein transglycosylase-like protein